MNKERFKELKQKIEEIMEMKKEIGKMLNCWISNNEEEELLKKVKERAICELLNDYKNIKINYEDFKEATTFEEIEKIANEKYITIADELAYKDIITKARRLLYGLSYDERKEGYKLEKIYNGNSKIKLYGYTDPYFYGGCRFSWETYDNLYAFEKLTRMIIEQIRPSKVVAYLLPAFIDRNKVEDITQKIEIGSSIFKSIKGFKNGNILVEFTSSDDAKRVAETLINIGNESLRQIGY